MILMTNNKVIVTSEREKEIVKMIPRLNEMEIEICDETEIMELTRQSDVESLFETRELVKKINEVSLREAPFYPRVKDIKKTYKRSAKNHFNA